jgi:pimeloyl-ACP methyl ester carboxylesterase
LPISVGRLSAGKVNRPTIIAYNKSNKRSVLLTDQTQTQTQVQVHFAHANSFPAGSYRKLFKALPSHFQVLALEKFGHTSRFPISGNWLNPAAELIDFVERSNTAPVYAIGHSFGAVISYIAVCKRPDLFKGLIMLDPPLITGLTRLMFKLLKFTPLVDKITGAGKTEIRCKSWAQNTDIVAYFKARSLFKNMDDECVKDYVDAVTELNKGHYNLSFDTDVEANIFRNVPHNINSYNGQLKVPSLLVTGQYTTVCIPRLINPFVKATKIEHKRFANGGHMFPLEAPIKTAELIASTINQWES